MPLKFSHLFRIRPLIVIWYFFYLICFPSDLMSLTPWLVVAMRKLNELVLMKSKSRVWYQIFTNSLTVKLSNSLSVIEGLVQQRFQSLSWYFNIMKEAFIETNELALLQNSALVWHGSLILPLLGSWDKANPQEVQRTLTALLLAPLYSSIPLEYAQILKSSS